MTRRTKVSPKKLNPLPPIKIAVIGWAVSCQLREGGGGGRAPTGQREANTATVLTLQEHIVILNWKQEHIKTGDNHHLHLPQFIMVIMAIMVIVVFMVICWNNYNREQSSS